MNCGSINIKIVAFIEKNKRNPSEYNDEERWRYLNWLKHNRKMYAAGEMKDDRKEAFQKLLNLCEQYRRINQYQ